MNKMATKINDGQENNCSASIFWCNNMRLLWLIVGFLLLIGILIVHIPKQPQIATVDINKIVNEFVKTTATKNFTPEKANEKVNEFGVQLENHLQSVAKARGLILLPSEAVIVGAKDFTKEMQRMLSE